MNVLDFYCGALMVWLCVSVWVIYVAAHGGNPWYTRAMEQAQRDLAQAVEEGENKKRGRGVRRRER